MDPEAAAGDRVAAVAVDLRFHKGIMNKRQQTAILLVALSVVFGSRAGEAAGGEVSLYGGMASGTYGTGLDSDVATTRIVYNTGDKYQFKIDAGWIRVESPYGVLPGAAGPLPMQRRQGDDTTGNGRELLDFGPTAGITGNLFSQAWVGEQPEAPAAYPPLSEPEAISASGVGDVYLAFSRRFVGGGAKVFRMDGGVEVKAPIADADEGLGTGEWDTRVGLSSEYRFWSATGFAGLGWSYLGDPSWVELNNVVDAYAGIESNPLGGRVILSGWLAGNPEVVAGVGSRSIVGMGFRTTGQWRFRLQATAGLTDGSEDFSVLFALSHGVQTPTVGTRGPRR